MPEREGGGGTAPTSEPKIVVVNSTRIFHASISTKPAFVRNLFQNGYPSTLKLMLKHSVWLPEHCFQFKYLEFHSQIAGSWLFWFESLRPINNFSVIKGRVFLGWSSTKLGLIFLLKDTTQCRRWGSNPRPFGLEWTTLPLRHCAPKAVDNPLFVYETIKLFFGIQWKLKE